MNDESIYSQPGGSRVESQQDRLGARGKAERARQAEAKALRRQERLSAACQQPGGGEVESQQEYFGSDMDL